MLFSIVVFDPNNLFSVAVGTYMDVPISFLTVLHYIIIHCIPETILFLKTHFVMMMMMMMMMIQL